MNRPIPASDPLLAMALAEDLGMSPEVFLGRRGARSPLDADVTTASTVSVEAIFAGHIAAVMRASSAGCRWSSGCSRCSRRRRMSSLPSASRSLAEGADVGARRGRPRDQRLSAACSCRGADSA